MIRRFFKDSFFYGIGAVITRGLSVLLVPIFTRVFSPKDYGTMDMLTIFSTLVNLTIALEISQAIGRYLADAKDAFDRVLYSSSALWFTVAVNTFFLGLMVVSASPVSTLVTGSPSNEGVFRVAVLALWANGIFYFLQNQLRWEMKKGNYAMVYTVINVIVTLVTLGTAIPLVVKWKFGVAGNFYGIFAGNVAGIVLAGFYLRTSFGFHFKGNKLKEMLIFSLPLVPSSIGVFVSLCIDRIAIKLLMTMADVGLYGIGYRIASVVNLLMFGFQGALMPLVLSQYKEADTPQKIATIFRLFMFGVLLLFIAVSGFSKEILMIFTTPNYYSAHSIIPLLLPAAVVSGMYIFAPGLALAKKTKSIAIINISVAVTNTILNFALIPVFGIEGAALATLLSGLGGLAANIVLGNKYYKVPIEWRKVTPAIVIAIVIVVVGVNITSLGLVTDYLVKGALVLVSGIMLGFILLNKGEINKVLLIFGGLRKAEVA